MRKVLMGLLMFMAAAAVVNAAVIDTVTIQGRSSEYLVTDASDRVVNHIGYNVQDIAVNVINGSGFDEKSGFHTSYTSHVDWSAPGTMWRTRIGDASPWIMFNLGGAHALSSIKVWNYNFAPDTAANDNRIDLLGVGVQEMNITLYDSTLNVLAVFGPLAIDKAPGLSTVDFGQVIDIAALNGGVPVANVSSVGFDNLSNHGGATGQVGLSEVRFYNDIIAPDVEAGDHQRAWLEVGSVDIVLDGMVDYDGAFTATWTGFLMGNADPNLAPVIDDPNSLMTTATLVAPGAYQFTLTATGGGVPAEDWLNVVVYEEGADGLLAHWTFDEGVGVWAANAVEPNFFDIPVDGTYLNWSTEAVLGGALEFFGGTTPYEGGYMFTPGEGEVGALVRDYLNDNTLNAFSVSLWFKASDPILPVDHGMNYRAGKCLIDNTNWKVFMRGDRLAFIVTATNPHTTSEDLVYLEWTGVGTTPVNDGQWHFLTLTFDGYSVKLYLNSRLEAERITYDRQLFNAGAYLTIGARNIGGTLQWSGWSGWLDDVKIYNLPLTQADVAAAYAAGGRTPCLTLLAGDLDADCQVDLADFVMLAQDWLDCTNAVVGDCFN